MKSLSLLITSVSMPQRTACAQMLPMMSSASKPSRDSNTATPRPPRISSILLLPTITPSGHSRSTLLRLYDGKSSCLKFLTLLSKHTARCVAARNFSGRRRPLLPGGLSGAACCAPSVELACTSVGSSWRRNPYVAEVTSTAPSLPTTESSPPPPRAPGRRWKLVYSPSSSVTVLVK